MLLQKGRGGNERRAALEFHLPGSFSFPVRHPLLAKMPLPDVGGKKGWKRTGKK